MQAHGNEGIRYMPMYGALSVQIQSGLRAAAQQRAQAAFVTRRMIDWPRHTASSQVVWLCDCSSPGIGEVVFERGRLSAYLLYYRDDHRPHGCFEQYRYLPALPT